VLHTPIPQILLAFEGKIDFTAKTNPFGVKKKPKPADLEKLQEQRAQFHRLKLDARDAVRRKKESR
jgi:hypothetical protein